MVFGFVPEPYFEPYSRGLRSFIKEDRILIKLGDLNQSGFNLDVIEGFDQAASLIGVERDRHDRRQYLEQDAGLGEGTAGNA